MSAAKLKPCDLPDWPRRMGLDLAAAYMGVSPGTFLERVKKRQYPAPIAEGRRTLWDRQRLDQVVDIQSGLGNTAGGNDGW